MNETNMMAMTATELAREYVTAYVANLPHDELENEIERRGVDSNDVAGIMSGYCLSSAEDIERATDEEFGERIAAASGDITEAIREAEGLQTVEERFGRKHNPVLRWTVGDCSTLSIESEFTPCSEAEENVTKLESLENFCDVAGLSPDDDLNDDEWMAVLRGFVEE